MRTFSVVPEKPWDEFTVELIGSDQELLMIVDKFFLQSPIEPFHVGIHFGSLGISMPMVFVQTAKFLIEVLHELRAIVSEHGLKRVRKDLGHNGEELSGRQRSMALGGPGKTKSRIMISKRDDISAQAI